MTEAYRGRGLRPDALLEIRNPRGASANVIVEHAQGRPQRALEQLGWLVKTWEGSVPVHGLLTASYLSPKLRAQCAQVGIGYADGTGSFQLDVPALGLFLLSERAGRPERVPTRRSFARLAGPGASAVVEELLSLEGATGIRDLAARVGVDPATVSRTVAGLADDGLVDRSRTGEVLDADRQGLLRRWSQDYRVFSRRRIALDVPRPASAIHRLVREAGTPATFTTSVALRAWLPEAVLPITELSQVVAYTVDVEALGGALRGRPVSIARAPLVLLPVTDATAPRIAHDDPRWGPVVSVPRAMVDLMTSGGRGTEEAEQLLATLAERDSRWR